jgi:hypothetical protein
MRLETAGMATVDYTKFDVFQRFWVNAPFLNAGLLIT